MKNFSDPKLTEIARKLQSVTFEACDALEEAASSATVLHGVQPFPQRKNSMGAAPKYAVVINVATKQRIIGMTTWRAAAMRFADMARLRFFKYKLRSAVEPTDEDLNFTLAQAKSDLQFETAAVQLLDEIEEHFKSKGFWKDDEEQQKEKRNTSRARSRIAALEQRMDAFVLDIDGRIAELNSLLLAIRGEFKRDGLIVDVPQSHGITEHHVIAYPDKMKTLLEPNRKIVTFRVNVPDPTREGCISHSVDIEVEARIENGVEILTPEAHEKIEQVKRFEIRRLFDLTKQTIDEAKSITDPVAELFATSP